MILTGIKKVTCLTLLFLLFIAGAGPHVSLQFSGGTVAKAEEYAAKSEGAATEAAPAKAEGEKKAEYPPAPKLTEADYPKVKGFNGRIMIWLAAQLHLWFAAFVLAVPFFVLILEGIGMATKDERDGKLAYVFIKVSLTAFSITAIFGGLLAFSLMIFYPDFMKYMTGLFSSTMLAYAFLFFAESASLYIYYYGWHWLHDGFRKWVHLTIGLILNGVGTTLMFLANAWVTFMMSPGGVDAAGVFQGNDWAVIHNFLWNPINLHRFVANVAYGGSVVGAYAAYRFLSAQTRDEKAHYDWM